MRAWQPTRAGPAAGPSYRSVLLSEETVGSTYLTHGLEVAFDPRRHRRHPDRPGQRPYSSSTLARRHEDTRRLMEQSLIACHERQFATRALREPRTNALHYALTAPRQCVREPRWHEPRAQQPNELNHRGPSELFQLASQRSTWHKRQNETRPPGRDESHAKHLQASRGSSPFASGRVMNPRWLATHDADAGRHRRTARRPAAIRRSIRVCRKSRRQARRARSQPNPQPRSTNDTTCSVARAWSRAVSFVRPSTARTCTSKSA